MKGHYDLVSYLVRDEDVDVTSLDWKGRSLLEFCCGTPADDARSVMTRALVEKERGDVIRALANGGEEPDEAMGG